MDNTFGQLRDSDDQPFAAICLDDVAISTPAYEGDDDNAVVDRHIEHCAIFLRVAAENGIQFKLTKCKWAQLWIKLLGFEIGLGVRRCDPKKVETLRNWPEPQSRDDVVSFRAYCNYLKEFIPGYHDMEQHLREYTKQG